MNNQTENKFTITEPISNIRNSSGESKISDKAIAGKITNHIGTGSNAKDSFIWMTITWSFYISTGLSILLFLKSCFSAAATTSDVMTQIKDIWSIFSPIITLALGYAFGKGQ